MRFLIELSARYAIFKVTTVAAIHANEALGLVDRGDWSSSNKGVTERRTATLSMRHWESGDSAADVYATLTAIGGEAMEQLGRDGWEYDGNLADFAYDTMQHKRIEIRRVGAFRKHVQYGELVVPLRRTVR
jgi:hypothetical protein